MGSWAGNPTISQPVGPMVTTDPLRGIIQGLITGTEMHQQIQTAQDQHAATQRQAAQQDRNNRIQDIQQQMLMNDTSRPVSDAGTVQGDPITSMVSQMAGTDPNAPANPLAGIGVTLPGAIRKADPSRTTEYVTQDGKKIRREWYTPEEQLAKAVKAKGDEAGAGMVDVPIPPSLQPFFGGQKSMRTAPAGASSLMAQMMERARSLETRDLSPEDQKKFALPAQIDGDLFNKIKELNAASVTRSDVPKTPTTTGLAATATSLTATPEQKAGAEAALARLKSFQQSGKKVSTGAAGQSPQPDMGKAGVTGEDFISTLPSAQAARVKAIAEGRESPITGIGASRGEGAALMRAVEQYDPTWSAQRAQVRKAFTTGPDARNIGALNTATVHLDQLHEAAKAMRNGTWQPGNALYNYVAEKFGKSAPTNYGYVMNALAGETASALKGNATDPEIAHIMKTLSGNLSPDQAQGIAENGLHVMGAKLNTYDERYHQQSPDDPWSPVLPSAKAVYARYKINPTANAPKSNGPPPKNADEYLKSIGH